MVHAVIFIPVNEGERSAGENFYRDTMNFVMDGSDFYTSKEDKSFCLNLLNMSEKERKECGLQEVRARFPIFRYFIQKNFLSYCKGILDRGGQFDCVSSDPGGYSARVIDPFGNTFEIMCESWDEADKKIDPFKWPFYRRY